MKLTKEEKGLLESIEKGEYKSVSKKEKARHEKILNSAVRKDVSITLRISRKDLGKIKASAEKEGIPYQTLITSILHKYLNKVLIDINEAKKIKELLAA